MIFTSILCVFIIGNYCRHIHYFILESSTLSAVRTWWDAVALTSTHASIVQIHSH